eukprot:scaffold5980_cov376-Prasinococcus_capsulatus_cf.AAC.2
MAGTLAVRANIFFVFLFISASPYLSATARVAACEPARTSAHGVSTPSHAHTPPPRAHSLLCCVPPRYRPNRTSAWCPRPPCWGCRSCSRACTWSWAPRGS